MRLGWLILLTLLCALLSLGIGRYPVSAAHSLLILLEPLTGPHSGIDEIQRQVILGVRVPRVLLAMGPGRHWPYVVRRYRGYFATRWWIRTLSASPPVRLLAVRWPFCSACQWRRCCCPPSCSAWRRYC